MMGRLEQDQGQSGCQRERLVKPKAQTIKPLGFHLAPGDERHIALFSFYAK
jgi:hypothetical protein